MPEDENKKVAIIGSQVAERNNLSIGRTLRLNSEHSFEIVGIASSGEGLVDNAILTPLKPL